MIGWLTATIPQACHRQKAILFEYIVAATDGSVSSKNRLKNVVAETHSRENISFLALYCRLVFIVYRDRLESGQMLLLRFPFYVTMMFRGLDKQENHRLTKERKVTLVEVTSRFVPSQE